MADLLSYQTFYLVGIKGVAMTSLAQCLHDAGKQITGSDVKETFVTQPILDRLNISIDSLESKIPSQVNCLVYTAAHQGPQNPQVLEAQKKGIPTFSHAEALASLFNQKKGVAVCGVGGKSTVSAMITWILESLAEKNSEHYQHQSFSVGVGDILGLNKTGQWEPNSDLFIAEADDYVVDPSAPLRNEAITPRFSYLKPQLIICTNLYYDHPDVYKDFDHTKEVFAQFFKQLPIGGTLIINGDDKNLLELAEKVSSEHQIKLITFGTQVHNSVQLIKQEIKDQHNKARIKADQTYDFELNIPGEFNSMNALAAAVATKALGIPYDDSLASLASFKSTKRRFEYLGTKKGVHYYDDYAHHPHEVAAVITAIQNWSPKSRIVVAFQPHTFSRTKALFDQFASALSQADEVVLLDIFSSAREQDDPTINSNMLCRAINPEIVTQVKCRNLHSIKNLADFCQNELQPGDTFITLGAGDIYQVHDLLSKGNTTH